MEANLTKSNPLVSICIPAYNSSKYIAETLHSLLNQSYKNFEIIVCDDSSTDNTIPIIKSFNSSLITITKNKGKGASSARNEAFKISNGDLIIFFDADDVVQKNFIASQVVQYLQHDDQTVIYSSIGRFYNNDIQNFKIDEKQNLGNYVFSQWIKVITEKGTGLNVPGRYLIPRSLISSSTPWNENLSMNDDFPFFTKIYKSASKVVLNAEVALMYRSGNSSLSNNWTKKAIHSYWESLNIASEIILEDNVSIDAKKCCASLFQNFIYNVYPEEPSLIRKAEIKVNELGGCPTRKTFRGLTGILSFIFGWKFTARFKKMLIARGRLVKA